MASPLSQLPPPSSRTAWAPLSLYLPTRCPSSTRCPPAGRPARSPSQATLHRTLASPRRPSSLSPSSPRCTPGPISSPAPRRARWARCPLTCRLRCRTRLCRWRRLRWPSTCPRPPATCPTWSNRVHQRCTPPSPSPPRPPGAPSPLRWTSTTTWPTWSASRVFLSEMSACFTMM